MKQLEEFSAILKQAWVTDDRATQVPLGMVDGSR